MLKRKIFSSREVSFVAKQSVNKVVKVYSFFPVDRADCVCQKVAINWKMKLGNASQSARQQLIQDTPYIICPRNKHNMKRYAVMCAKCNEVQGYCWATDATLRDWCDFHYVQWTKGDYWRGCFTPHISPITQQLCFECCCGQDTRDFRANMTLNKKVAEQKEKENAVGRNLGFANSKFIVKQVRNMVP